MLFRAFQIKGIKATNYFEHDWKYFICLFDVAVWFLWLGGWRCGLDCNFSYLCSLSRKRVLINLILFHIIHTTMPPFRTSLLTNTLDETRRPENENEIYLTSCDVYVNNCLFKGTSGSEHNSNISLQIIKQISIFWGAQSQNMRWGKCVREGSFSYGLDTFAIFPLAFPY